ncbi:MAG: hypothetical protein WC317_04800 [Candidatus Omnitrophota bacterium]|jgi:hypothetical protein
MKRFAIIIILLYGAILVVLTVPTIAIALRLQLRLSDAVAALVSWRYWVLLLIMLVCQAALLGIPVRVESKRLVTKGPIIFTVVASGFLAAFMVWAAVGAIVETLSRQPEITVGMMSLMAVEPGKNPLFEKILMRCTMASFLLIWLIWGLIFYRWSQRLDPKAFIEKQCRTLFAGSALELLIAVPTHVIVRGRDYCCAGFSTFIGIALGISVMLLSFGPGVYFLFLDRWKKLHPQMHPQGHPQGEAK